MKKLLLTVLTLSTLIVAPVYSMGTHNTGGAVQLWEEPTATVEKLGVMAFGGLSAIAVWMGGGWIYRSVTVQMPWALAGTVVFAAGVYGLASAVRKLNKDYQN